MSLSALGLLEQKHDRLFDAHPKIEVVYEDLADDFAAQIHRIQAFLTLASEGLMPRTFKQAKGRLSELILNYEELKRAFSGSPWEGFFDD